MRHYLLVVSTALLILPTSALLVSPCQAQSGGKKPAAGKGKPPAKKPTKSGGPIVLGTKQMPGDFGKLGTTYTIGKTLPLNFTLKSADYSVAPVTIGQNTWVPKSDEKVLLLHYTVHNPLPDEQPYYWGEITFTAVDSQDKNHSYIQGVVREGEQKELNTRLKPAQKVDVAAAIIVPAEGVIPKLIVERQKGSPVIRYDLRDKVKPLPAPFADPADTTGATARKEVAAQAGTFYPTGAFDTRLDEVAYVPGPLKGHEAGAGKRFLSAVFTIKNRTIADKSYIWSDFMPDLRDADGEKVAYNQEMLKATRDEAARGTLAPGEEARVRFFFPLPADVMGKTLRIAEGKLINASYARVYAFDVAAAAAQPAQK